MKLETISVIKYIPKALSYFIKWYTSGNKNWDELTEAKKVKISLLIRDKDSLDSLGEFLVCAMLIEKGFDILHANISFATLGKASERGIDGILEKDNKPYIVEIKTNPKSTKPSFDAICYSLNNQLDQRAKNIEDHFKYVADLIEDKRPGWIDNFEDKLKWFIDNAETNGYILTGYNPELKKTKHDICVLLLEDLKKELPKIKSSLERGI